MPRVVLAQSVTMDVALSQSWDAALSTLRAVAAIDDIDEFGPRVLEEVDRLIRSDLASFNEVDPVAGRAVVASWPISISIAAAQVAAWERWSHQNPSLIHMLRTGDGSACRISDFLSRDELHHLELYEYVFKPFGIEYQVAVGLPAPQPVVVGIALNRVTSDFTDDEVALLNVLRPHFVQAYRRVQLLDERRRVLESVSGILHNEGRAFHVIGTPVTDQVGSLWSPYFAESSSDVPTPVQSWLDDERAALVAGRPERLSQPLVCLRDGSRLTIRYVPGGRGPDLLWLDERVSENDATPLRRLGLTSRQAEILWLLTKGLSTKSIASELNLSVGTVKKHLEHVYRKLGVATGTAAVAQAFDALAATLDEARAISDDSG